MQNEPMEFLRLLVDFAEEILNSGAEINRVEDTVCRMGTAFGAKRVNVFVITSVIVITLDMPNGETFTESRRIASNGAVNFSRLEALNKLSRKYCAEKFSVEELRRRFNSCLVSFKTVAYYIGSVIAAFSFAIFFGGTLFDGLVSGIFALFICLFSLNSYKFCPTSAAAKFLCSLITGVFICAVCRFVPVLHADKIMIGDIMLLIPGIALVNSTSNIIVGDTVSGLTRFTESVVQAAALAGGFMLAIFIVG